MSSPNIYGREFVYALRAADAVEWDRHARAAHGIPERVLMQNAGHAVAAVTQKLFPHGPVVALVGSGHNGGDALIALRELQRWGREVSCVPSGNGMPAVEALQGWQAAKTDGAALRGAAVLIDGALGTGTRGASRDR